MIFVRVAACAFALGLTAATAQVPYGRGTPGTGNLAPRLSASQPFVGNATYEYRIDRAVGGAPAALLLSTAPAARSILGTWIVVGLGPGEFLFSVPFALGGTPGVAGDGSARIPGGLGGASSSMVGAQFYLQCVVADQPPSGAVVAASQGLFIEVTEPPLMFVASPDVQAGTDPFLLIDPVTAAVVHTGAAPSADDVTGAVFGRGGRDLFVASRSLGSIERLDLRTSPPRWSTLHAFGAAAHGIAFDRVHGRLYTVVESSFGSRDLVVVDGEPASPTFGAELARFRFVGGPTTGGPQWALSASGRRLAIHDGSVMKVIDTDPASPAYLVVIVYLPVPDLVPPFNHLARVLMDPEGDVAMAVLTVGFFPDGSGVHRLDVAGNAWIDHAPAHPGIQPIGALSVPRLPLLIGGNDATIARDGSFVAVTAYDRIVRIELDPMRPAAWDLTELRGNWTPSTSFGSTITTDGRRIALFAPAVPLTDSMLTLVDSTTGAALATTHLVGVPWVSRFAER